MRSDIPNEAHQAQQPTAPQRKQAEIEARIASRNAAERQAAPRPRKPKLPPRLALGNLAVVAPPAGLPAPVSIKPGALSAEVVTPPDVTRTTEAAPPGRYAVTQPVIGGFASMRPGQYLAETGFSSYLEAAP